MGGPLTGMFALTNAQVQDRKKSRLALCARRRKEKEEKKKKQFSLLRAANVHKTCIQSVHNIIMAGGEERAEISCHIFRATMPERKRNCTTE